MYGQQNIKIYAFVDIWNSWKLKDVDTCMWPSIQSGPIKVYTLYSSISLE